ncbi:hypothetical protein KC726_02945 [Candidatus Woesebacteria bacterium]|nr:hypothetical protein [Candidatus Woesebacteria bacterium]
MKFHYTDTCGLFDLTIEETQKQLTPYTQHLQSVVAKQNYEHSESSINLPTDTKLEAQVKQLASEKITQKLKYVVIIGIGGSNLGTKAVYDALRGYYDQVEQTRFPRMVFLDTQHEETLSRVINLIQSLGDKEEILINAISKSGGTTETIVNLEVVFDAMKEKFQHVEDRFVITTSKDSAFQNKAHELGIATLTIPETVGGRFSVLSAVGLFPLLAVGINIDLLRQGATEMRNLCVDGDLKTNPAALSATILYLHNKEGKNIHDSFFFAPQLESLGKWYRQLTGESIGKEGKGITPTASVGSNDLHSVVQLYLGGPKDKITSFVYPIHSSEGQVWIPQQPVFGIVQGIAKKQVSAVMKAIIEGVKIAYKKRERPYVLIEIEEIGEKELGAFLQFKMIEMMYLGRLLEVNTFDQPEVELYKIETKRILQS